MPTNINIQTQAETIGINTSQGVIKGPVTVEQNLSVAALQEQINYVQDPFWLRPDTDVSKWDRYAPYQLLVVEAIPNSALASSEPGVSYRPYKDWRYTLPLPPESMQISTPFAIQTTVTLNGIVEEHNAAPIRHISFRGTTGFLPLRGSGATREGTGAIGQLESIFGGTVNSVRSAIGSLNKAADALTNTAPKAYNVYQSASFDVDGPDSLLIKSSGFNQIALLRDFLESYVAKKKLNDDVAKTLRLAVCVWKEDQVFLVTPINFHVVKDASSPLEYKYSLDFKAWRRIELDARDITASSPIPIRRSPNLIARAINTLTNARQAVQTIGTLRQAVLGDIDYIFKPFHDTILLGKDLLGATLSLAEVPLAIKQRVTINVSELKYNSAQLWNQITSSQTYDPAYKALKYAFDDSSHIQDMPVGTRYSVTSPGQNQNRATSTTPSGIKPRRMAIKDIPEIGRAS